MLLILYSKSDKSCSVDTHVNSHTHRSVGVYYRPPARLQFQLENCRLFIKVCSKSSGTEGLQLFLLLIYIVRLMLCNKLSASRRQN